MDENISGFDGKISINDFSSEIYITNFEDNKDISIYEIENSMLPRDKPGTHTWERKFDNSFLVVGGNNYKIAALKFQYKSPEIFQAESIMDFSDYLYAIMEYIGEEEKKVAVMRDGVQKHFG